MRLAYYVSGHGFGHAVRAVTVLNGLRRMRPDAEIAVCTQAPQWLFQANLRGPFQYRATETDPGVAERDLFDLDLDATVRNARSFFMRESEIVRRESEFVRREGIRLILSDVPWIASEIAEVSGVPSIAVSNFGWDLIYRALISERPELKAVVERAEEAYAKTTLLLRPPLCEPMSAFPRRRDIPLVARRSTADPSETREFLGIAPDDPRRLILLIARHPGFDPDAMRRAAASPRHLILSSQELPLDHPNILLLTPDQQRRFIDVLAACDLVMTKPGYCTFSDCIAHEKPILLIPRFRFAEAEYLKEGLWGLLPFREIELDDFLQGDWSPYIDELLDAPKPGHTPTAIDGAESAAREALAYLL